MIEQDLQKFKQQLETQFSGEIYLDDMSRYLYSTDASLYRLQPVAVAVPRNEKDVEYAIRTAAEFGIAVLSRGGGTSLAGQTVTTGLVLDFSKYMNQVLELNTEEKWIRVQPGIVLDNLNHYLKPYGLFFAPDVATSSRANLGGMMGNNSSGVRSVRYGKTVDHVLELKAILSSGETVLFQELGQKEQTDKLRLQNHEGEIYRKIREIIEGNRDLIRQRFPSVMRRVSGYNLDLLLEQDSLNLAKLLVGSEGTLAAVTEAKLNLVPIPPCRAVLVLHYSDLLESIDSVKYILKYDPTAVEVLDSYGLLLARENPAVAYLYKQFIKDQPDAILIVEFSSEEQEILDRSVERLKSDPVIQQRVIHIHEAWSESEQNVVWGVRKNALGVMLGIKGDFKPLPFIEDSCIPVEHLAEYVAKIQAICDRYSRRLALYAHASVGVIHLRPLLNLKQEEDLQILQAISEEAFDLVVGYKGSWSGEHGDGLVRSYKLKEFFGEQLYEALREVKKAFDPKGLMNPGKIIDPPPMTESLRIHPGYRTDTPKTYYRFENEGGFDRAVEMCTGVGQCRKTLTGIMCPSFIATGDEEHSTRGRANALRAIISGELGSADFSSDRLYEVMDLCIECKGCKTECPSGVDMAKMKAEFLAHYYDQKGLPLRKRIVGNTRSTAELASLIPGLSNLVMNSSLSRKLLEKWAGFDNRRPLPSLAKQTFNAWYKKRKAPSENGRPDHRIVLFSDTFSNYYEPSVARSAVSVLEAMKLEVILGEAGCCGRPLISAGLLEKAKIQGAQVIKALDQICPESRILVLEPSCYSTFKDDYLDLLDDRETTKRVVDRIVSIEELMADSRISQKEVSSLFTASDQSILLHGHCQQKALLGSKITAQMLGQIPGAVIEEVPEGCCGMAGSFGYEKEHYDLSRKIAERHLVPAVSAASESTELAVSGFSCRSQIKHLTGRKSFHPVEVLARHLKNSES